MKDSSRQPSLPQGVISADMSAGQFSHYEELMEGLPRRPKLIPELLLVPASAGSLTLYGAQRPRTLHCPQGTEYLRKLLDLLDGSRTVAELQGLIGNRIDGGAIGLISLLLRYGLLEEGDGESDAALREQGEQPAGRYFGRFIGNTRQYDSRYALLAALHKLSLIIVAPEALCASLTAAIDGLPFAHKAVRALEQLTPETLRQQAYSHALFISFADAHRPQLAELMDSWLASGNPYFQADITRDEARIGPLTLPGFSATHRCVAQQLPAPDDQPDRLEAASWAVFAANEFVQRLSGTLPELYINNIQVHQIQASGCYTQALPVARLWDTVWAEGRNVHLSDGAFPGWLHHVITRSPPWEYLSPQQFQSHFSLKNVRLYEAPLPPVFSDGTTALSGPLAPFGELLRYAVGRQTLPDGGSRRIAPTGGSLQSVSLYLQINQLPGLAAGFYFYDDREHALQAIVLPQPQAVAQQLYGLKQHEAQSLPDFSAILVSDLARLRSKYDDFSLNLSQLDAGVASAFLTLCAATHDWHLFETPDLDQAALRQAMLLANDSNDRMVSTVFHLSQRSAATTINPLAGSHLNLGELMTGGCRYYGGALSASIRAQTAGRHRTLLELLDVGGMTPQAMMLARRAGYHFSQRPLSAALLARLVQLMWAEWQRHSAEDIEAEWQPWLIIAQDNDLLSAGVYQCHGPTPTQWEKRAEMTRELLARCVNQHSFNRAGAVLLVVARLNNVLNSQGIAGYQALHRQAGAALAYAWLGATGAGLIGAPCGRFIERSLNQAGIDGYRQSVIFSLVLGYPEADRDATRADER